MLYVSVHFFCLAITFPLQCSLLNSGWSHSFSSSMRSVCMCLCVGVLTSALSLLPPLGQSSEGERTLSLLLTVYWLCTEHWHSTELLCRLRMSTRADAPLIQSAEERHRQDGDCQALSLKHDLFYIMLFLRLFCSTIIWITFWQIMHQHALCDKTCF